MTNYESFSFGIDEYAGTLTGHSHQTLMWLHRHGYLDAEQTDMLLSRMVVVPIRNTPKFGERLLNRFFGRDSGENAYVFPITLVDDEYEQEAPQKGKPNLTVVE